MSSFKNLYIIIFKKINNKLGAKSLAKHLIDPRHSHKKARPVKDPCIKGTLIKIKSEPEKEHAVISKTKCAVHVGKNGNKPKMVLKKKMQFNFVPFLDNPFMWLKGLYKNVYIDDNERIDTKYKVLPSSLSNLPSVSATSNTKVLHSKSDTPVYVREKSFSPLSTDSPSVKNVSVVTKDISCSTLDERSILATCLCVLPLAQSKMAFKDIKEQQINDKLKTIESNDNKLEENLGFPNCFQTFKTYSSELNNLLVGKSFDTVPLTVLHVNVEDIKNQISDPESSKEQAMTKILSLDNDDKIKLTLLLESDDSQNKKSTSNLENSKIIVSNKRPDCIEHIIKNYKVNLLSTLGDYDFSSFNSPGGKKKPPKKETKKDKPTISNNTCSSNTIQRQQQRPLSKTSSSTKHESANKTKKMDTAQQQQKQQQQQQEQQWQMAPMQAEQMYYYWPTQAYNGTSMWQNYSQFATDTNANNKTMSAWQNYGMENKGDTKNTSLVKQNKLNATETSKMDTFAQQTWPTNYYAYNAYGQQQDPVQSMYGGVPTQYQPFEQNAQQVYSQMMQQTNENEQQFQMMMDSSKKSVAQYTGKSFPLPKMPKIETPKKEKKSAKKIFTDTLIHLLNIPNGGKQQTSAKQQQQHSEQQYQKSAVQSSSEFNSAQKSTVHKQEKAAHETCMPSSSFDKQETSSAVQPLLLAASFMPLTSKQLSNPIEAQQTPYNNPSAWPQQTNAPQTNAQQQFSTQQESGTANTSSWLQSYNKTFNQQTPEQSNWRLDNDYMTQQSQWYISQQPTMYPNSQQTLLPPTEEFNESPFEPKPFPQPQEHIKPSPEPEEHIELSTELKPFPQPQEHIKPSHDDSEETSEIKIPPQPQDDSEETSPTSYSSGSSPTYPQVTFEQTTFPQQISFEAGNSEEGTQLASEKDTATSSPTSKETVDEDISPAVRDWEKTSTQELKVSKMKKGDTGSQYEISKAGIKGTPILNAAKIEKPAKTMMMGTSSNVESTNSSQPVYPFVAKPTASESALKPKAHLPKKHENPAIRSTANIPKILKETSVMRDILTKADSSLITQQKNPWQPNDPIAKSMQTLKKTASKQENFGITKNMLLVKQLKNNWQQNSLKNSNVASLKQENSASKQVTNKADNVAVDVTKKSTPKVENQKSVPNVQGLTTKNSQTFVKNSLETKQETSPVKNETSNEKAGSKFGSTFQEIAVKTSSYNKANGLVAQEITTPQISAKSDQQQVTAKSDQQKVTAKSDQQQVTAKSDQQQVIVKTDQQQVTPITSTQNQQQQICSNWSQNGLQTLNSTSAKWNEQQAQPNANLKDGNNATVEQQQQQLQPQQLQQYHLQPHQHQDQQQQYFPATNWQNTTTMQEGQQQNQQNFYETTGQQQSSNPQDCSSQTCNTSVQQNHFSPQTNNPWQQTSSHQYHTLNDAIAKQKITPVQSENELQQNYKFLDSYSMFDPKTDLYRIKNVKSKTPDILKNNEFNFIPKYKTGLIEKVEKHYYCWKKLFFDKSSTLQNSKNISIVKQFEETLEQIKNIDNSVPSVDNPEIFLPISFVENYQNKDHKLKEDEKKVVISANKISCRPAAEEKATPKSVVREEIKSDDLELLSKIDALVDVKPRSFSEKAGLTTNDSFLLPKQLKDFPNIAKRKLHILNVENVDLEEMCRHSSLLLNCRIVLDGSERNEPNTTLHAKVYDFNKKKRDDLIFPPPSRNNK